MSTNKVRGRRPQWTLRVLDKAVTDRTATATVGVGWSHPGGHISIALNPGVVLNWRDGLVISLFPNDDKAPEKPVRAAAPKAVEEAPPFDPSDNDFPVED